MKSQSVRAVFSDVCVGLFGRVAGPKPLLMSLMATSLVVFSFPPAVGQETKIPAKTSLDPQPVSGTAYLEDGHLVLEGTAICIQKTNPSTGDLLATPTVTARYAISEEWDSQSGTERLSGIRLHSGTKTLDLVLSCSAEGLFYKVYRNGQEMARKAFLAEAEYALQISVTSEGMVARIAEDGQEEELARLEYDRELPNPAKVYFYLESNGEPLETLRKFDSIEILSPSIQPDDTAVSRWRIHTP